MLELQAHKPLQQSLGRGVSGGRLVGQVASPIVRLRYRAKDTRSPYVRHMWMKPYDGDSRRGLSEMQYCRHMTSKGKLSMIAFRIKQGSLEGLCSLQASLGIQLSP